MRLTTLIVILATTLVTSACQSGTSEHETKVSRAETENLLGVVSRALDMHFAKLREYPATLAELVDGRKITAEQVADAWGAPLSYQPDGPRYTLCSNGPDKQPGSADDICHEPTRRR